MVKLTAHYFVIMDGGNKCLAHSVRKTGTSSTLITHGPLLYCFCSSDELQKIFAYRVIRLRDKASLYGNKGKECFQDMRRMKVVPIGEFCGISNVTVKRFVFRKLNYIKGAGCTPNLVSDTRKKFLPQTFVTPTNF